MANLIVQFNKDTLTLISPWNYQPLEHQIIIALVIV